MSNPLTHSESPLQRTRSSVSVVSTASCLYDATDGDGSVVDRPPGQDEGIALSSDALPDTPS